MRDYLPIYGNNYWETPNIDELAKKGTVFLKHYTAAPSTAMAFTSMFTGLYGYQTNREKYIEVEEYKGETLFDKLYYLGYRCHVIWDKSYMHLAKKYSECYGKDTMIHNMNYLTKNLQPHIKGKFDDLSFHPEFEAKAYDEFHNLLKTIVSSSKKIFVWIHFPHVIAGRNSYGSDIDLFDKMIGIIRKYFSDDSIYITADHGHMNGTKGKFGYGFDVNESAIKIPFITPRINGCAVIDFPTSNTQLEEVILEEKIHARKFIYSETAYYAQPHRKLAIISGNYKYIYEKAEKKEILYDIEWDKEENINLFESEIYDVDRRIFYSANLRYFYPYWEEALSVGNMLRLRKNEIWRNAPLYIEAKEKTLQKLKLIYTKMTNKL